MIPSPRPLSASLVVAGLVAISPAWCVAAEADLEDDKHGYHLFHPTPSSLLRDLSTDRPDLTESPYSVDAGHLQVELEAASYARDESNAGRSTDVGILGVNAKLGLLPSMDLQVGVGIVRHEVTGDSLEFDEKASGPTDMAVRLKWNLWGNDGGATAMALMPFLKLPTGSPEITDHAVEGGLIVPFAVSLSGETGLGVMVEADLFRDQDGSSLHGEWLTTATLGRGLNGPLRGFVEIAAGFRPRWEGTWIGTLDAGLTYGPTPNVQLDAGVLLGVSEAADGATFFMGLSFRR